MLGACMCVTLCVFCCQPLIGRSVCLPGIIDGVCVCVCLCILFVWVFVTLFGLLVSVDLLVLSSSTCTAGCHTLAWEERRF